MTDPSDDPRLLSFDCELVPVVPGTPAAPRPSDRPRDAASDVTNAPTFFSFDCELVPLPAGTPAAARPDDRPRVPLDTPAAEADAAFARELADRVLEYVRSRPSGLSAAQLAALVQQLLTRRSA